jgi:hypothetical protein
LICFSLFFLLTLSFLLFSYALMDCKWKVLLNSWF